MDSFYGGPNGQSFYVKKIFTSKYPETDVDSMTYDLALKWQSPISVGEFVVISYGLPNDSRYETLRDKDLNSVEKKTFNSTLWQKVFNKDAPEGSGLDYKLIASMTGNTPKININDRVTVLDADQYPDVQVDNTNVDLPTLTFALPQSQVLQLLPVIPVDVGTNPSMTYDDSDEKINRPELQFSIPKSQNIAKAQVKKVLNADEEPAASLDKGGEEGGEGTVNEPVLNLELPQAQRITEAHFHVNPINPGEKPSIDFKTDGTGESSINEPDVTVNMPQTQKWTLAEAEILGPSELPKVRLEDNPDKVNQQMTISLPRATNFYYGDLLGEKGNDEGYKVPVGSIPGCLKGDYYIHIANGYTYKAEEVSETEITFKFVAALQAPVPQVKATTISPYKEDKNPADPTVESTYESEQWNITVGLPKAPRPSISHAFVPPDSAGAASVEVFDTETLKFNFEIPRGAKIFTGSQVTDENLSALVVGAESGDVYINTEIGKIYKLSGSKWEVSVGDIVGPPGPVLNIVKSWVLEVQDSFQAGVDYITQNYQQEVTSYDLFGITFRYEGTDTSYWYFRPREDSEWNRVLLTGGTGDLFASEYDSDGDENKGYSRTYINALVGADDKNKNITVYSKQATEELISWGEFTTLQGGE